MSILYISNTKIIYDQYKSNQNTESHYKVFDTSDIAFRAELDPQNTIRPLEAALSFQARIPAFQRALLNSVAAILGISLLVQPVLSTRVISAALLAIFCLLVLWRSFLIIVGVTHRLLQRPAELRPVPDQHLPIYTILIPAYREAAVMQQLARAMSALNWPGDKLDIQILLEAGDDDTLMAAHTAPFPRNTRLMIVSPDGPKTKPNALNFGLRHALGDFVTVYDAEDIPHPDQMRAAYETFSRGPPNLVSLQAPLVADNAGAGWLQAQWALEYDVQFGLLLPGLSAYRMPLLLGGTSNHFRKQALLALGGWDAWNVTEDADLGLRVARAGLLSGTISTPTYEDAPARFDIWRAQRSRWIKGYIQTWLVLMRTPTKTLKQMGLVPFITAHLNLGGAILAAVLFAPCILFVVMAMLSGQREIGLAGTGLLIGALVIGLCSDLAAPGRLTAAKLFAALTRPFYWPLHSIAAIHALWELAEDPFFWAKTPHQPRMAEPPIICSTGSSSSALPQV